MTVEDGVYTAVRNLLQFGIRSRSQHLRGGAQQRHPDTLHSASGKRSGFRTEISSSNFGAIVGSVVAAYTLHHDFPRFVPILAITGFSGELRQSFCDKQVAVHLSIGRPAGEQSRCSALGLNSSGS